MIELSDVELYAERKNGTCLEVFSSIVGSESKASRSAAVEMTEKYCAKVVKSFDFQGSVAKTTAMSIVKRSMTIDDLMIYVASVDAGLQKERLAKFIIKRKVLRNLALRIGSFVFDFDYSRLKDLRDNNHDLYLDVGSAIFLAGLYLEMQSP